MRGMNPPRWLPIDMDALVVCTVVLGAYFVVRDHLLIFGPPAGLVLYIGLGLGVGTLAALGCRALQRLVPAWPGGPRILPSRPPAA